MRQFLLGLSFSAVFIVGWAVGTLGSNTANAQTAPASGAREYRCERVVGGTHKADARKATTLAMKLAAEGWELETASNYIYCFERTR